MLLGHAKSIGDAHPALGAVSMADGESIFDPRDDRNLVDDDFSYDLDYDFTLEEEQTRSIVFGPVRLNIDSAYSALDAIRTPIDIHSLTRDDCTRLLTFFTSVLEDDTKDIQYTMRSYQDALEADAEYWGRVDAEILRGAAVVGMTTNGAAKYSATLRALRSEILIVEEAAEVLEASIVASITSSTKHIILIGDHQQLRPQVNEYSLAHLHKLEISLFERLIASGISKVTLTTQRRMHPDISSLISPTIYRRLENDASVFSHAHVKGVQKRLFFLQHDKLEDIAKSDEASEHGGKSNLHEAQFIVKLAQHLLYNGYSSKQIVILAMYREQIRLIRREAKALISVVCSSDNVSDIRVSTTDNYQGEECDVILLSLVRSNKDGNVGFVKTPNRINVALSRARNGMFVIGNFEMIRAKSKLWNDILRTREERGELGEQLQLVCENHRDTPLCVECAEDFAYAPYGGCALPCTGSFPSCGHDCTLSCHPLSHDFILCLHKCEKPRPNGCTHRCRRVCGEDCPPCEEMVKRSKTPCSHELMIKCSEDIDEIDCYMPCRITMQCGHPCSEKCSHFHSTTYKCLQQCPKTRLNCLHPCPKRCYEDCGPCKELVMKELPCKHMVQVECGSDISLLTCDFPCERKLPCDHPCTQRCGDPCDIICKQKVRRPAPLCKNPIRAHRIPIRCSEEASMLPCSKPCKYRLECGHQCGGSCSTCGRPDDKGSHQLCKERCSRRLPCNHNCSGNHACKDPCPPCEQPCELSCSHRKCTLLCGFPCEPCAAKCNLSCPHQMCCAPCGFGHIKCLFQDISERVSSNNHDICAVDREMDFVYCDLRCSKKLQCSDSKSQMKHQCMGLCGEVCPPVCIDCMPNDKIFNPFKGMSKEEKARLRFITLTCGHTFEQKYLERHVRTHTAGILSCPETGCFKPLQGAFRYAEALKISVQANQNNSMIARMEVLLADYEELRKSNSLEASIDLLRTKRSGLITHSENALIELLLGKALYAFGKFREVEDHLVSANSSIGASGLPNNFESEILYYRGLIRMKSPKTLDESVGFLQKALSCDPSREDIKNVLTKALQMLRDQNNRLKQIEDHKLEELMSKRNERNRTQHSSEDMEAETSLEINNAPLPEVEDKVLRNGGSAAHYAVFASRIGDLEDLLRENAGLLHAVDRDGNTRNDSVTLIIFEITKLQHYILRRDYETSNALKSCCH